MKSSVEWNEVQCEMEWNPMWNGMKSHAEVQSGMECNEMKWNRKGQPILYNLLCNLRTRGLICCIHTERLCC